jgi:preprotein translocase subunit SecY
MPILQGRGNWRDIEFIRNGYPRYRQGIGSLGLSVLAAVLPYLILRFTQGNAIVAALSLIVLVQTLDEVQNRVQAYRAMESYEGLLSRPK